MRRPDRASGQAAESEFRSLDFSIGTNPNGRKQAGRGSALSRFRPPELGVKFSVLAGVFILSKRAIVSTPNSLVLREDPNFRGLLLDCHSVSHGCRPITR